MLQEDLLFDNLKYTTIWINLEDKVNNNIGIQIEVWDNNMTQTNRESHLGKPWTATTLIFLVWKEIIFILDKKESDLSL